MQARDDRTSDRPSKCLYRSRRDRMIAGVCGGLAEYLGLDSTIVRVIWIVLALMGGSGIIAYIAGVVIVPNERSQAGVEEKPLHGWRMIGGLLLLGIGVITLLKHSFPFGWSLWSFPGFIMPVGIILLGILLVSMGLRKNQNLYTNAHVFPGLRRSRDGRIFLGICAGIGLRYDLDPTIIRLVCIVAAMMTGGAVILLYLLLFLLIPESQSSLENR